MTAILAATAHVPGLSAAELPGSPPQPAEAADDARLVLGRKGLLGKEPATLLALCAVHRLFGLPPGRPAEPVAHAADTAVVVASHLGNVQTVCQLVADVRTDGVRGVSAMAAPNASSNVIASTVALWYGLTGPNLAVCSGATSGLDAVRLATVLLRAGRARRVLVVGAEPDDGVASALVDGPLQAGAAAILLGDAADAAPALGPVREAAAAQGDALSRFYGAAGVLGLVRAYAEATPTQTIYCGDAEDGFLAVELTHG